MSKLSPYLGFNGNCREAMEFYKACIGGELQLMPMQNAPEGTFDAEAGKEQIMHAQLEKGDFVLMGSDMLGSAAQQGNTISLCMNCDSKEQIEEVFAKLSQDCQSKGDLHVEFWGDIYGEINDKFGFRWMLVCSQKQ